VLPLRGAGMQLTSSYELRVSGDSLFSDLPYFGRAYSISPGSSGGGFNFVSLNNRYQVKSRKKDGWEISIKPDPRLDVREFQLTVFSNGSASLHVTSNNRDPISFNGYVNLKK